MCRYSYQSWMQLRYQITQVAYRGGAFETANNNNYFTSKCVRYTMYQHYIIINRYLHLIINKVFYGFRYAPASCRILMDTGKFVLTVVYQIAVICWGRRTQMEGMKTQSVNFVFNAYWINSLQNAAINILHRYIAYIILYIYI